MPKKAKANNPVYAEVVEANDDRTVAALVLFDRRVRREFRGPHHLADARAWAGAWDKHLGREWGVVRATAGEIMELFAAGLKRRGVGDAVIAATLEELVLHGQ